MVFEVVVDSLTHRILLRDMKHCQMLEMVVEVVVHSPTNKIILPAMKHCQMILE